MQESIHRIPFFLLELTLLGLPSFSPLNYKLHAFNIPSLQWVQASPGGFSSPAVVFPLLHGIRWRRCKPSLVLTGCALIALCLKAFAAIPIAAYADTEADIRLLAYFMRVLPFHHRKLRVF